MSSREELDAACQQTGCIEFTIWSYSAVFGVMVSKMRPCGQLWSTVVVYLKYVCMDIHLRPSEVNYLALCVRNGVMERVLYTTRSKCSVYKSHYNYRLPDSGWPNSLSLATIIVITHNNKTIKGDPHLKPSKSEHICSCHNFSPLSSVQILLIPTCCLLCVL